ncbi:MAG: XRE family transcriptional regulator [Salinivirgaceae bacterium]|nr:XRE family transcriptional regulator [Salinivirgaceae bacterium]
MVHIGKEIQQAMKQQGRSPSWLARQLNCERQNIYSIYKRQSIDSAQLALIGQLLNIDFFDFYRRDTSTNNIQIAK